MSKFQDLEDLGDNVRTTTVRAAAKLLGVDRETVEGLICAKKIKGYRTISRNGYEVALVDAADLRRVAVLAGRLRA